MCGIGDALTGSTMFKYYKTLIASNYAKVAARPQSPYHAIVSISHTYYANDSVPNAHISIERRGALLSNVPPLFG